MFQSFHVELKPRATVNEYRNMLLVTIGKECIIAVCKALAEQ
jgi:hypothetical protein